MDIDIHMDILQKLYTKKNNFILKILMKIKKKDKNEKNLTFLIKMENISINKNINIMENDYELMTLEELSILLEEEDLKLDSKYNINNIQKNTKNNNEKHVNMDFLTIKD